MEQASKAWEHIPLLSRRVSKESKQLGKGIMAKTPNRQTHASPTSPPHILPVYRSEISLQVLASFRNQRRPAYFASVDNNRVFSLALPLPPTNTHT
jgi:hypothetical protein